MQNPFATLVCVASVVVLTACSSISGSGTSQSLSVQTLTAGGQEVEGAKCDMTNDEGKWFVVTPGSVVVHRSNKDLQVVCKKEGHETGTANVVSRTKGSMFGNIIFGGGIGAVIDHNNGSAYDYPVMLNIVLGQLNQRIEEKQPQATQTQQAPK